MAVDGVVCANVGVLGDVYGFAPAAARLTMKERVMRIFRTAVMIAAGALFMGQAATPSSRPAATGPSQNESTWETYKRAEIKRLTDLIPAKKAELLAMGAGRIDHDLSHQVIGFDVETRVMGGKEVKIYSFATPQKKAAMMQDERETIAAAEKRLKGLKDGTDTSYADLTGTSEIGDIGYCYKVTVKQVVDPKTAIVVAVEQNGQLAVGLDEIWLTNVDTSRWVDGKLYDLGKPIKITGTKQYDSVDGGARTILQGRVVDGG
jgi:hypothetical protein